MLSETIRSISNISVLRAFFIDFRIILDQAMLLSIYGTAILKCSVRLAESHTFRDAARTRQNGPAIKHLVKHRLEEP